MISVLKNALRKPRLSDEEKADTLFNWVGNKKTWIYLGRFLLFSMVIHSAGFYLFKVVYPTPSRVDPAQGKIAVLGPGDPLIRSLLQRVQDRSIFFLPMSRDFDVRVQMQGSLIPFSPGFGDSSQELLPLDYPWTLPFVGVEKAPDLGAADSLKSRVVVERDGGLSDREFAPWSIFGSYISQVDWVPEIRLRLDVRPDGTVSVSEFEGDVDESAETELVEIVGSTLRFQPAKEASDGWIRIFTKDN